MARETVSAFFEEVEKNQALLDQYRSLLKGMAEAKVDEAAATEQVAQFASQRGFAFTAEDLRVVAGEIQSGELSDERLEAIAGGGGEGMGWVFFVGVAIGDMHMAFCIILGALVFN